MYAFVIGLKCLLTDPSIYTNFKYVKKQDYICGVSNISETQFIVIDPPAVDYPWYDNVWEVVEGTVPQGTTLTWTGAFDPIQNTPKNWSWDASPWQVQPRYYYIGFVTYYHSMQDITWNTEFPGEPPLYHPPALSKQWLEGWSVTRYCDRQYGHVWDKIYLPLPPPQEEDPEQPGLGGA